MKNEIATAKMVREVFLKKYQSRTTSADFARNLTHVGVNFCTKVIKYKMQSWHLSISTKKLEGLR